MRSPSVGLGAAGTSFIESIGGIVRSSLGRDSNMALTSVSMVSGGKTSAYMAIHYPTDRYLFTPVLSNDPACRISGDSLRQYCQDKVDWFDWDQWGSREVDLTLNNLRRLEQKLGTEIEWVAAPFTFDQLIAQSIGDVAIAFGQASSVTPLLPNRRTRTCTQSLKIYPAAWHLYLTGNGQPYVVHIGYRSDEPQRIKGWKCDGTKMTLRCDISGQFAGKHRHSMLDYRVVNFPLYHAEINSLDVLKYWHGQGWEWPEVSNCDYCMFHQVSEHKKQYAAHPGRSHWWMQQEENVGATFGDKPLHRLIHGVEEIDYGPLFSCMCGD